MSPASSESIQSGTPSSDFPLEKVSSYLTDDFDDMSSMRPARAYSVGSRSDTSSMGKNRSGKNRLEAVQEFRIRAMSVGSKAKVPFVKPNSALFASPVSCGGKSPAPPLSSSWSGSTGRWPPNKFNTGTTNSHHGQIPTYIQTNHTHTGSESNDSDLMELDFSHNKSKSRKRSLPGPNNGSHSNTPTGSIVGSGSISKLSPVAKALLGGSGRDTPPATSYMMEPPKSAIMTTTNCIMNGIDSKPATSKYVTSDPISIQKAKNPDDVVSYQHASPVGGSSILTKMTGMDLNKLKELDDEGAYLDMDFSNKSSTSTTSSSTLLHKSHQPQRTSNHHETINHLKNNFFNPRQSSPVVVRANESPSACKMSRFSMNSTPSTPTFSDHRSHHNHSHHHHSLSFSGTNSKPEVASTILATSLVRSLSSSSNLSTISGQSNSSSNSSMSVKTQQEVDAVLRGSSNDATSPKSAPTHSPLHNSHHSSISTTTNSLQIDHSNTLPPTTSSSSTSTALTRIEEFPEKIESRSHNLTPLQSPPRSPLHQGVPPASPSCLDEEKKVTYAAIEHLPPVWRSYSAGTAAGSTSCGSSAVSQSKASGVTYAQIDFVKSSETIAPN